MAWLVLLLVLAATPALAHPSALPPEAGPGWTLDPSITLPIILAVVLFAVGWSRLRRRSGQGRPGLDRRGALFAAGMLLLIVALVSPLHEAGERSFAFHMLEHELLMLVAAPLLVLSRPLAVMLWAFPSPARRGLGGAGRSGWVQRPWRALTEPITTTLVQAAVLWLWHAPSLFDLALGSEVWHAVQHLCFLLTALLFWSAMLTGERRRNAGLIVGCLFFTSIVSGALGAVMAFSSSPWYARYAALGMTPQGLTPDEDQQLAGLLMWIPGGLVHAVAALAVLARAMSLTGAAAGPSASPGHSRESGDPGVLV
ncbi:MAG: cytochrome c oxidase assembly protein [Caulobacteraceae bacterium]